MNGNVNKYFVIFINDTGMEDTKIGDSGFTRIRCSIIEFSEAYRIVENAAENPVETKITSSLIISFIKSQINCVYR